jgi:hypothetical protein
VAPYESGRLAEASPDDVNGCQIMHKNCSTLQDLVWLDQAAATLTAIRCPKIADYAEIADQMIRRSP